MSKVDLKRESERRLKNKAARKCRRDTKLQELERQLEFAESRCGTLKQQLDYIKRMYGCARTPNLERQPSKEEGHGDGSNVKQFSYTDVSRWKSQNGNLVNREDGDGPELLQNSVSHSNTTTNSSSKPPPQEKHEDAKKKSSNKPKAHFKLVKTKKKNCKKMKKRRRSEVDGTSSKVSNASSQTHNKIWQDPVVEIYKNSAVNVESESGFDISNKKKLNKSSEVLADAVRQKINNNKKEEVAEESKARSCNSLSTKTGTGLLKDEGMQTELTLHINQLMNHSKRNNAADYLNKESATKTECVFPADNMKSYCQPTISSKRKQVERDIYTNLTNLKIRNIPFVAAKSTAPSHNIGVNIQQVLSIIKKRQPKNDYIINCSDYGNQEKPVLSLITSRRIGSITNQSESVSGTGTGVTLTSSSESKKRGGDGLRTSLSHWKSNSEISKEKARISDEKPDEDSYINININNNNNNNNNKNSSNWSFKVDKLKKVLVFLHEDFSSLTQKYKRLQKKLTKRNITKTDAKDELAEIERDLEKKEEEITVVIALYKEVLNLREDFKKLQERYNAVTCGKTFAIDVPKQSNSAHTQMTTLLRKIQNFQDKLKG